jgi:hypothetical protein
MDASVDKVLSPRNGCRPHSIWYKVTPRAKMSVRASSGRRSACSGDMIRNRSHHSSAGVGRIRDGGVAGRCLWFELLREPEVQHLDATRRNHDVGWLEVAVNDSLRVRRLQRVRDLAAITQNLIHRHWPAGQKLIEAFATDQLHDQILQSILLADVVHAADVGVIQRGYCQCLAPQSRPEFLLQRQAPGAPHP